MIKFPIAFVHIFLLQVVFVCFHVAVIHQQQEKYQRRYYSYHHRKDKHSVLPNLIVVELSSVIVLYHVTSNQAKHADAQLAIEHNIYDGNLGSWRQRVVYHWHQPDIDDHESGDVADLVVHVGSLDKGEEGEYGNEYKRDEDGEGIHNGVLIEGDGEGDYFVGAILAGTIGSNFREVFFAGDIKKSLSQIILSQAAIISEVQLLEDTSFLVRSFVSHSLHAIKFKLHHLVFLQLDVYIFETQSQLKVEKIERSD